jgi:folate-binding protein YgfZ
MSKRKVIRIGGEDRQKFLQDLVTNDIARLATGLVYAALLTPQGKYLSDFFLTEHDDAILLDLPAVHAPAILQRLSMYKLRAAVTLEETSLAVSRGTGPAPAGALADPRHPSLGWRLYGAETTEDGTDWDAVRVAHCIPEADIELIPNETYILEAGFDRLHGVDFKKGCYVGQEVTARMRHKTELRKGFATVLVEGTAPVGTPITRDGKAVGTLFTQSGGKGIAFLRYDRANGRLQADGARVDAGLTQG